MFQTAASICACCLQLLWDMSVHWSSQYRPAPVVCMCSVSVAVAVAVAVAAVALVK